MDDWGVAKFQDELNTRLGRRLDLPSDLEWTRSTDYLGWHRQNQGKWFVGVRIISGRIEGRIRLGLRTLVEHFGYEVRLTAQQNLYLVGIADQNREEVSRLLKDHGITPPESLPPVLRHAPIPQR